jgi:transglutaminase-like putative cysteine protease
VELVGIKESKMDREPWNKGRQKYSGETMEIWREVPPFDPAFRRPYNESDKQFSKFLLPEFNIESDHEEIIQAAEEIVEDVKDPLLASRRVLTWVYGNLEKRPVVSIPSAVEVIRTKVGDCNEHATLTTALLRASGIPSRIAVGLVYMRGNFFYHAWTEFYIGQWITMDATMNQMPVDATHIKLIEGNLDKQVDIAGLIGNLGLKIIDYGYD